MDTKNDISIFTVCNISYLHKALVLADSVYANTGHEINIFLFDKKKDLKLINEHCVIHWVEDLKVHNFLHLAFRYDIIEFSTSLKPYITLYLLENYSKVIFFDPDIYIYQSIHTIIEDLDFNSILLTPHYTTPQSDDITESDTGMMRFGSFNLGFFGIRKSDQSLEFLRWWSKRCIDLCYMESQFGLSTDQKWVSIAPCLFEDIKVSFHLGYNAAPWNSYERKISWNSEGSPMINNKFPLIFFHFSNFDHNDPGYLKKRSLFERGKIREDLERLGKSYSEMTRFKYEKYLELKSVAYAYNYMSNGEYISPLLRLAYSSMYDSLKEIQDPFDSNGKIGAFAKKNYLLRRKENPLGYMKNCLNENSSFKNKIKLMNVILRGLLWLIGPNKFYLITRGLVYFSSPRLNKTLWKNNN